MRSDAYVRVTCDKCHDYEEEIHLTALAKPGAYDERNVESDLKREGWKVLGAMDICPNCAETE